MNNLLDFYCAPNGVLFSLERNGECFLIYGNLANGNRWFVHGGGEDFVRCQWTRLAG